MLVPLDFVVLGTCLSAIDREPLSERSHTASSVAEGFGSGGDEASTAFMSGGRDIQEVLVAALLSPEQRGDAPPADPAFSTPDIVGCF